MTGAVKIFDKLLEIEDRLISIEKAELKFMNVDEAAEYLKISKSALYKLTMSRGIKFFKKGKLIYFQKSDLQDWILSGEVADAL